MIGWSGVARNFGHIDLHIEPTRTPIFGEVSLAAGCELNSGQTVS
jgi:hypothetical protein